VKLSVPKLTGSIDHKMKSTKYRSSTGLQETGEIEIPEKRADQVSEKSSPERVNNQSISLFHHNQPLR
jgi:hypothetical protein